MQETVVQDIILHLLYPVSLVSERTILRALYLAKKRTDPLTLVRDREKIVRQ